MRQHAPNHIPAVTRPPVGESSRATLKERLVTGPAPLTPDRVLIQQIAGGDSTAAQQLYRRHSGSLYALAYGVLMDSEQAEMVVGETFHHAWRRANEFDPAAGAAYSWLAQIARACARARALLRLDRRSRGS